MGYDEYVCYADYTKEKNDLYSDTLLFDLEEIKRIAISELGMTYAEEGQIILYSSAGTDYMRRTPTAD